MRNECRRGRGDVVERMCVGVSRCRWAALRGCRLNAMAWCTALCALVWVMCVSLVISPVAQAADSTGGSSDQGATASITDPGHLLGGGTGKVSDAIARTLDTSGVRVRVLYVSSFHSQGNPTKWASDMLEATNPQPDTVLLAVAPDDGNLVVAVSSNSHRWLRNDRTVRQLSDAALKPVMDADSPDWAGSAIAMMECIARVHQASVRLPYVIGGLVLAMVAAVVLGIGLWRTVRHRVAADVADGGKRRAARHGRHGR